MVHTCYGEKVQVVKLFTWFPSVTKIKITALASTVGVVGRMMEGKKKFLLSGAVERETEGAVTDNK